MADGVHEVGLAQADPAVQEQRVVRVARPLGDRQCRGVGQPVGRPDDEVGERVSAVQVDRVAARGADRDRGQLVARLLGRRAGRVGDDELDTDRPADDAGQGLRDQGSVAVVEPVTGEAVGGRDPEQVLVDLLERGVLQPRLEVGGREADLQLAEDGAPHLFRIHIDRRLQASLLGTMDRADIP
jgi:hypothetical protein